MGFNRFYVDSLLMIFVILSDYYYGAVRLSWEEDEKIGVFQKWNPFGELPYLMFTSHHILYNEKEKETETYNCDEFISSLEYGYYSCFKSSLFHLT